MSELKPCPFCGGEAESGVKFRESCGSDITLVALAGCKECGVWKGRRFIASSRTSMIPFSEYLTAFNDAIVLWNRRAQDENV